MSCCEILSCHLGERYPIQGDDWSHVFKLRSPYWGFPGFPQSLRQMSVDLCRAPDFIPLLPFSSDRHDWRGTRGKWALAGNPDRSWRADTLASYQSIFSSGSIRYNYAGQQIRNLSVQADWKHQLTRWHKLGATAAILLYSITWFQENARIYKNCCILYRFQNTYGKISVKNENILYFFFSPSSYSIKLVKINPYRRIN